MGIPRRINTMADTPYTEGFRNGRAYEQERILRILEEHLGEIDWDELVERIRAE
jgi:hypothetical protein